MGQEPSVGAGEAPGSGLASWAPTASPETTRSTDGRTTEQLIWDFFEQHPMPA